MIPAVERKQLSRCLQPDLGKLKSTELNPYAEETLAAVTNTQGRYDSGKDLVVLHRQRQGHCFQRYSWRDSHLKRRRWRRHRQGDAAGGDAAEVSGLMESWIWETLQ